MDKKTICEAMYALPGGVVVRRKKNYILPALTLMLGIVLVILNYQLDIEATSADVSSALMLTAGATIIVGMLLLLSRIFDGEGRPWHLPSDTALQYEERFFPVERREEIRHLVEDGAYLKLVAADTGALSGIAVSVYRTKDLTFVAMQAYEYVDYEYQPITAVRCIEAKKN